MTFANNDNQTRAHAAGNLLRGYSVHKAPAVFVPLDPDDLRDAMADAMHLCRREGWDFADILEDARINYEREVEEEDHEQAASGSSTEYLLIPDDCVTATWAPVHPADSSAVA